MKKKIIISLVLGFLLGILANRVLPYSTDTARHWRAVEQYNAFMRDKSNYKPDSTTGFAMSTPPFAPESHLASLVEAGELQHLDIVLPSVPKSRVTTSYWMRFCEHHRDIIVFATGNSEWVAFKPRGTPPTHLNIWYKPIGEPIIQQLIKELETIDTKEE